MPNIKSAKKRLRQNEARHLRNQIRQSRVRTSRRRFMDAIEAGEVETARAAFAQYCSALDKAAKKKVIAKNNAIRSKTRAANRLAQVTG